MKRFPVLLLSLALLQACSKKDSGKNPTVLSDKCGEATLAILQDKTGLDGCRWVLKLNNGDYLEPTNLSAFDVDLVDNKPVAIKYTIRYDLGSVCMIGMVVDIDCIDESYREHN